MNLSIICNVLEKGWSPWDKRLGGSEETIVKWASGLTERNHTVRVFHNGRHGIYKGVLYEPQEEYDEGDVTINVNYPQFGRRGKTFYYSTLTGNPDVSQYDAVGIVSEYARATINHPNIVIIPPGYDSDKIYPAEKIPKQCLYASSPDRGLDTLAQIWPSVVEKYPDAQLIVTYGGQINTPNTTCGEYTENEMNELFNTSDIWVHPANGGELYCISGIKAQVAGAVPVYFPTMALAETVKEGVACKDGRDMYAQIISLLDDEDRKADIRYQLSKHEYPGWEKSVDLIESSILKLWKSQSKTQRVSNLQSLQPEVSL